MNVMVEKICQIISEDVHTELMRLYNSTLGTPDSDVMTELDNIRESMYPGMKKVPTSSIKRFQMLLKGIKEWTPERVAETTEHADDIKKLYKGIYYCGLCKVHTTLSNDSTEAQPDEMDVRVPKLKTFLHSIYLNVGRELYNNPRSFILKPLKFQEKVNTIITETLTKYMPVIDAIMLEKPHHKEPVPDAMDTHTDHTQPDTDAMDIEESLLSDPTSTNNSSNSGASSSSKSRIRMSLDPSLGTSDNKFYNEIVMKKRKLGN